MPKRRITRATQRNKMKKLIIIMTICLLFVITVGYAAFNTNLTITAKGNIIEKNRVIQKWSETSNTDFHTDYYKENIVSVSFLNNQKIPSNAVESWDVSADQKGGVIAYVTQNIEDNTKYDLYIGAKDGVIANEDSSNLFAYFTNIRQITFNSNFDTSHVTNMENMFRCCINLTTLDLTSFDTSKVTNMRSMFNMWSVKDNTLLSSSLSSIIFGPSFNTNSVIIMANMFAGLQSLKTLDISQFNTSNVTDMYHMFYTCEKLENINLSNFDTSKVTNMERMFDGCKNLTKLDLSSFNTQNVTTMMLMFNSCTSLTELNLCTFNTSNVINMQGMFKNTSNIKKISVGPKWLTSQADISNMFYNSGVSKVTTNQC